MSASNRARTLWRGAGLSVIALSAGILAGCEGHGQYTQEFKDQALQRMATLKAATSWDMAGQQFKVGDLDKALKNVDQSIALDNMVAKSHLLRGRILLEMDRLEIALDSFDRAIGVDPANADAYYYQGIVFERFSEYEYAHEKYLRSAQLDPSDAQYTLAAAEMLIQLDRIEEAKDLLKTSAKAFEHNAGIRQTLGHIAMMQDNADEALELFGEACLLAPADSALLEDLGHAQLEAGEFADAEYTLRRLIDGETQYDRRDLKHLRAKCLVEIDRPVEAREILQELANDGNNNVGTWIDLCEVSIILDDDRRLRQYAQRAVALDPRSGEAYIMLAMWQKRAGRHEDALRTLDRGLRLSDNKASVAIMQSVVFGEIGRETEAVESLRLALTLDPSDGHARRLLDRLTGEGPLVADALDDD